MSHSFSWILSHANYVKKNLFLRTSKNIELIKLRFIQTIYFVNSLTFWYIWLTVYFANKKTPFFALSPLYFEYLLSIGHSYRIIGSNQYRVFGMSLHFKMAWRVLNQKHLVAEYTQIKSVRKCPMLNRWIFVRSIFIKQVGEFVNSLYELHRTNIF